MQCGINSENAKFLEDYHHVLCHHINCILKSSMILDEDMQLVTTFWIPNLVKRKSFVNHYNIASVACATTGLLFTLKSHNLYPFMICVAPAVAGVCTHVKGYYKERKYKKNFEKLINLIRELYGINCSIIDYYKKKDMASGDHKILDEIYALLSKPGQEFLKHAIKLLFGILEKLKTNMFEICKLVPIAENKDIYSLKWNLDDFKQYNESNFLEMKGQFEKLSDLYVLMVSNFLSCMGLSFCVQLWQDVCCSFQTIFDNVIPELCHFLELTLNEIKSHFDCIRFTLPHLKNEIAVKENQKLRDNNNLRLERSLMDFLTNLQITFETAKQLQFLIEKDDSQVKYENLLPVVENIASQFEVCEVALNMFAQFLYYLSKQSPVKKVELMQSTSTDKEPIVKREIRFDDPEEQLEDEEYSLSIHGSEDEASMEAICDYADQCSTEHLELMLFELKRKLKERKIKKGRIEEDEPIKTLTESHVEIQNNELKTTEKLPPQGSEPPQPPPMPNKKETQNKAPSIPPPPIMVHRLPIINDDHLGFLDAVKNVAQNLNRSEEVFGSEAVSSCDSDES